jgi:hypothetical protein
LGFQFRDFFFNLGNCRENLRKFCRRILYHEEMLRKIFPSLN